MIINFRCNVDSELLSQYQPDLLCPEALAFLSQLQKRFGPEIARIRNLEKQEQEAIDKNIDYQHGYLETKDCLAIRAGNWKVGDNAVPSFMKTPGVILVSPADSEMIVKSQTTQKRYGCSPVANMIDFEDAFHLDIKKAMDGHRTLLEIKKGNSEVVKNGNVYRYNREEDGSNLIRIRVNGFSTPPVREIIVDGEPMERCLFDFGLHYFHNVRDGLDLMNGPYYVLPKVDYSKSLIWAEIFKFAEETFGLPEKTIKCSAIIETIKGDFEIQEVAFVLAGGTARDIASLIDGDEVIFENTYVESFCSGRHDRVFDVIKTYNRHPDKIFPESKFTGIHDKAAQQSWMQIAEIAKLRGITPVGGMVVALTSDPKTKEAALKITAESMQNEHDKGSVQAWEAMPDTTQLAMSILTRPFTHANSPRLFDPVFSNRPGLKRYLKLTAIEKEIASNLYTTPQGQVSYNAVYNNINQAIEYIEAWLRGYGVIPYRPRLEPDKPIMMQNMATTERARSELWTWIYHQVHLSDRNQLFDTKLFNEILNTVLRDIEASIEEGFLPKGKMSPSSFKEGYYGEAAEILKVLVLSETFADNMKGILLDTYQRLQKSAKMA